MYSSGHFVQPLDSNQLKLAPGRVSIYPFNPAIHTFSGILWMPDGHLTRTAGLHEVHFGIYEGDSLVSPMENACLHDSLDRCRPNNSGYNAQLENGHVYHLVFSSSTAGPELYRVKLIPDELVPVMDEWQLTDFAQNKEDTGRLGDAKQKSIPQKPRYSGDSILSIQVAKPGMLQFSFQKPFPWADSVFEYTWVEANNKAPLQWQSSGSRILLPINRQTVGKLTVRYNAMAQSALVSISVVPRWFDPLWVKFIIVGICLFICWGLFTLWKIYRVKQGTLLKERLTRDLLNMQATLAPHIMFNALSTLQDLMETPNQGKARRFARDLGTLLRQTVKKQQSIYQSLNDSFSELQGYIQLQQIRFGFKFEILADPGLNLSAIEIPAGILQPVVENAIKYNLRGCDGGLKLGCRVRDNGVEITISARSGKPEISAGKLSSSGFGLSWVRTRIAIHNQMFPQKPLAFKTDFTALQSSVSFYLQNQI